MADSMDAMIPTDMLGTVPLQSSHGNSSHGNETTTSPNMMQTNTTNMMSRQGGMHSTGFIFAVSSSGTNF